MRGRPDAQPTMFLMINLEDKVPQDHPLRPVKQRCDRILRAMSRDFDRAYSHVGRDSVPPEQLLKAMLLQALYSIPSEIKLMEHIDFHLLFRWFLDLGGEPVWTPETFSQNRERFATHNLVGTFFERVVDDALAEDLVSEDHFTVDGTLIQSWASLKSLTARDPDAEGPERDDDDDPGNPSVNFRGEKRSNATHVSRTDPEARLMRKGKGKEALLYHSGHVLMENRHGLILGAEVDAADGTAERRAARRMLDHVRRRHGLEPETAGLDAAYDDGPFLDELESDRGVVPHVPIRKGPIKATDAAGEARRRARRRKRTKGYALSQRIRKRVEEIFGWLKTVAGQARTRFVGRWKIRQAFTLAAAAYNLVRMVRLKGPPAAGAVA
jgi:transposase